MIIVISLKASAINKLNRIKNYSKTLKIINIVFLVMYIYLRFHLYYEKKNNNLVTIFEVYILFIQF